MGGPLGAPPASAPNVRSLGPSDWELGRGRQRARGYDAPVNVAAAIALQGRREALATKTANADRRAIAKSPGGAGSALYFEQLARERSAEEAARLADPVEQARLVLQRRGRVVYRMSVHDGDAKLWFISGLGRDRTDADVIALAERLAA